MDSGVGADPDPILRVEGIGKSYGTVTALDGVDLTVGRGEFVALLGLNGAGKTTLFQLLSGLFVPDAGTITLNGFDMRRHAVSGLRGLGIVFQEPTLDLDLPVLSSLRFHAGLHGVERRRATRRIGEELERIGLGDSVRTIARKLSGGNRRRVEVARALMHDPEILLLDEPTVGLDPATRRDLLDYVATLRDRRRIGVLWATHLIEEAERADRVVILHHGRVVENAAPDLLLRRSGKPSLSDAFLSLIGADRAAEDGSPTSAGGPP